MKIQLAVVLALAVVGCTNQQQTRPAENYAAARANFDQGAKIRFSNPDSAFYYFANVTQNSSDSFLVATSYWYLASIQSNAGDHLGGQESALAGLRFLNEKDTNSHSYLASLYDELGKANASLKNYGASLEYHDISIKFQEDETNRATTLNNKAITYKRMGDFEKAIPLFNAALASQENNSTEYARTLSNLAYARWRANSAYDPRPDLFHALQIRILENDQLGAVTSYNHLADYCLVKNPDSALYYSQKMYELATTVNNSDDKVSALQKLIRLLPKSESIKYFNEYDRLIDSIYTARAAASSQFAVVRYQVEESKAENLLLQQDNTVKELAILRQRVGLIAVAIAALATIIYLVWWYRKKKQRIEAESQNTIRENKLKTSQKVHDVVANGLYRVMTEIEHSEKIDKELLLDKVEELYERSRDLSYEPASQPSDVQEKINNLLTSFASPGTRVSVVGNHKETWSKSNAHSITELEHVLQELMVNMDKHSGARNVVIRFEQADNALTISYKDDGKGLPDKFIIGNGLTSTENRIRQIGGEFTFTNHSTGGMAVKIIVPNSIP